MTRFLGPSMADCPQMKGLLAFPVSPVDRHQPSGFVPIFQVFLSAVCKVGLNWFCLVVYLLLVCGNFSQGSIPCTLRLTWARPADGLSPPGPSPTLI